MLPITRVPETIAKGMAQFRPIFGRAEGFAPVSRSVTGLVRSPNKPLQGLDDLQGWERQAPSRRAMPAGVFEAGGDDHALRPRQRAAVAGAYRGGGRAVIALDGTLVHHERGPKIYAVSRTYDSVAHRPTLLPTVVTAVGATREGLDGRDVMVQDPRALPAEEASWHATAKVRDEQRAEVRQRVVELRHQQRHRRASRQRPARVVEVVQPWATEGNFPQAHYAFANGGLPVDLPRVIERGGTHGGSDIACARPINWRGQWRRVDQGAAAFHVQHPERFRPVTVTCRNGEEKRYGGFPKVVR